MSYSENTKESTIRTYKTTQQSYNQGGKKDLIHNRNKTTGLLGVSLTKICLIFIEKIKLYFEGH